MFLWPRSFWKHVYEPFIRQSAGLGKAPKDRDNDKYEHFYAFADVVVIGGGVAGLQAARAAGQAGACAPGDHRDAELAAGANDRLDLLRVLGQRGEQGELPVNGQAVALEGSPGLAVLDQAMGRQPRQQLVAQAADVSTNGERPPRDRRRLARRSSRLVPGR